MLRWTTSHQIPVDFETDTNNAKRTRINSTVIDDNVWMVFTYYDRHESKFRNQLAVFNTTSLDARKVDCEIPEFGGYGVSNIASQSDQLYILTVKAISEYKLYKLDTKTLIFSDFLNINVRLIGRLEIMDNFMYSLARSRDGKLLLITINLADKTVSSKILMEKREALYYQLFSNDDTLYLFKHFRGIREVYGIHKNEKPQFMKLGNAEKCFPAMMEWVDNSVITQEKLFPMGKYLLETIDFDTKEWTSARIEKHRVPSTDFLLKSANSLDNKIYMVFQTLFYPLRNFIRYEVRVLELRPKLTDICLLKLVDNLLRDKIQIEMDSVLEALPIPLRKKMGNMIEWRSPKRVE